MNEFSDAKMSEAGIGLKLDKMLISPVSNTKKPADGGYRGVQAVSDSERGLSWRTKVKAILLISGVLLPFVLVFFLWDRGVVDLPYLESKKAARELQRYATVGPVMTSIGKDQHLKLTVQIECDDVKSKNKVNEISSAIKNKILVILSSPEAKDQMRRQDYSSLKSEFEKEINRLLPESPIKALYIANILRY
jgi:flagellar basal body-associated protein FliL